MSSIGSRGLPSESGILRPLAPSCGRRSGKIKKPARRRVLRDYLPLTWRQLCARRVCSTCGRPLGYPRWLAMSSMTTGQCGFAEFSRSSLDASTPGVPNSDSRNELQKQARGRSCGRHRQNKASLESVPASAHVGVSLPDGRRLGQKSLSVLLRADRLLCRDRSGMILTVLLIKGWQ